MPDPTWLYNGDETGFQLDPRNGKVLAPRNASVYSEAGGGGHEKAVNGIDNDKSRWKGDATSNCVSVQIVPGAAAIRHRYTPPPPAAKL